MVEGVDLRDAIDIHTHVAPSLIDRRTDGIGCATEAARSGMAAVVLKEHFLPTVYGVHYVEQFLHRANLEIDVVGSLVMNYCNGGFNPIAVETAVRFGAGVIWAPTIDAQHHAEQTGALGGFLEVEAGDQYADKEGLSAFDAAGELREEVRRCLDVIIDSGVVLAIGHVSPEETVAMTEYVVDQGHEKVVIDHPNYPVTNLSHSHQEELVSLGARLNFPYLGISKNYGWTDAADIVADIHSVGVDNCVLSSDVGQVDSKSVPASLEAFSEALTVEGLSAAEIRTLLCDNPAELLEKQLKR